MMVGSGFYKQAGPTDLRISAVQVVIARSPEFLVERMAAAGTRLQLQALVAHCLRSSRRSVMIF